jgi:hypothetical protein
MKVNLESCRVKDHKITCELDDQFYQDATISGRGIVKKRGVISGDEEFEVEAPPYQSNSVGISIPLGPAPGAPSVEFETGLDFPITIFPIPTRVADRLGQAWMPSPLSGGKEDDYLPWIIPVRIVTPNEVADQLMDNIDNLNIMMEGKNG